MELNLTVESIGEVMLNPTGDKIDLLENMIEAMPQYDLKTTHVLSGGIYSRTIYVPAGCVLTGAETCKDHIIIMQGDITVSTDEGMKRLTGQHILPVKAGMRRVGYAHQDTTWTTVFHTELTNIEEIEDEVAVNSFKLQTRKFSIENKGNVVSLENTSCH